MAVFKASKEGSSWLAIRIPHLPSHVIIYMSRPIYSAVKCHIVQTLIDNTESQINIDLSIASMIVKKIQDPALLENGPHLTEALQWMLGVLEEFKEHCKVKIECLYVRGKKRMNYSI